MSQDALGVLTASHNSVYFPAPPSDTLVVENVVTVTYHRHSEDSDGVVLFRIKCSAPQKFHVNPRIGAIVVRKSVETNPSTAPRASITFSLKDEAASSKSAASPCVSAAPQSSTAFRPFQERFSITSIYIPGERAIDAAGKRRKEALVDLYEEATGHNGAQLWPHSRSIKTITLKVYLDGICWPTDKVPDGGSVVPPDAVVLCKKAPTSLVSPAKQPSQRDIRPGVAEAAWQSARPQDLKKIADETTKLRKELEDLEKAITESERDKKVLQKSVTSSTSMLEAAGKKAAVLGSSDDSVVRKRKRGIPFSVVLVLMVLTFGLGLYLRLRNGDRLQNPFSFPFSSTHPDL